MLSVGGRRQDCLFIHLYMNRGFSRAEEVEPLGKSSISGGLASHFAEGDNI